MCAGTLESFFQFEYFAHPLKRQCVTATSPVRFFTKIGQKSRVQLRSVG